MTKGAKIKIVIVSALLVSCIAGLTVYAGQDHTTDKDTTVVAKAKAIKEKVIVEESTEVEEAKTEELEPIKPVKVIPIVEVKEDDAGRLSNGNNAGEPVEGGSRENTLTKTATSLGDAYGEAELGTDSAGIEDNESEQGGDEQNLIADSDLPEMAEIEEPVPEEHEYVEPAVEEPAYEEPVVDEVPQEGPQYEYLFTATATAYCNCAACCSVPGQNTASGRPPISGHTIACNILPFYTQVMIDGVIYEVEDTGSTPYGDAWVDIYFDTHEEALAYGMRTVDVYLVR